MCQSLFPRIQEWLREAGRHDAIAIGASSQSRQGWPPWIETMNRG